MSTIAAQKECPSTSITEANHQYLKWIAERCFDPFGFDWRRRLRKLFCDFRSKPKRSVFTEILACIKPKKLVQAAGQKKKPCSMGAFRYLVFRPFVAKTIGDF
jgi:hypothetical protein